MDNYKIYVHINKQNGKMYIGQTKQKPEQRWKDGRGYKYCPYFYQAIQKYGWDGFKHIILLDCLSLEMANIFEKELITKYKTTNRNKGYNLYYGGDNYKKPESTKNKLSQYKYFGEDNPNYGNKWTDDMKQYLREKQKSNPIYKDANNPNSKSILCIETGEVFDCIKYAINKYSIISDGSITIALKKPLRTASGVHWVVLSDDTKYLLESQEIRNQYLLSLIKQFNNKQYLLCITDMIIYKSKVDLSIKLNVSVGSITWQLNKNGIYVYNNKQYIKAFEYKGDNNGD